MTIELIEALLFATVRSACPLFIAGLGVLLLEKSGVLNLGQEGIVALGAVVGFIAFLKTDSYLYAIFFAALSGIALIFIFAFLVLICKANQVASGLALSIFGMGLSAFIAAPYIGKSINSMPEISVPYLGDIPILGKLLFGHDVLVYVALVLGLIIYGLLYKTRFGMIVRGVGENPLAAHSLGYSPHMTRFLVMILSAALVGVAGAYISLVYTPVLSEGISAGRGWIALALVVFSSRLIGRLGLGALLFGFMSILHLVLQGTGTAISGSILAMMPYLITIVALIIISIRDKRGLSISSPKSLGKNFNVSQ